MVLAAGVVVMVPAVAATVVTWMEDMVPLGVVGMAVAHTGQVEPMEEEVEATVLAMEVEAMVGDMEVEVMVQAPMGAVELGLEVMEGALWPEDMEVV